MNSLISPLTKHKLECVKILIIYCFPRGFDTKSPYFMHDTLVFD